MEALPKAAAPMEARLEAKYHALLDFLAGLGSAVTAFSAGVDSSLVAFLAYNVLGAKALAVTSSAESLTREDLELSKRLAKSWGLPHRIVKTGEMANPNYRANPTNRCYFCKTTLYADLAKLAERERFSALLNGTNRDDLGGHRPGLAAAKEFGVLTPLADCGFGKKDVRALARHLGLENAEKPQAACLSSRVPYGLEISIPVLKKIEEGEKLLRKLGFGQLRLRHHHDVARIEVLPDQFQLVLEQRKKIEAGLRRLGYRYVTLDLRGFRSGSLNEGLEE